MEAYVETTQATGGVAAVPTAFSCRPERAEVRVRSDMLTRNAAAGSRRQGVAGLLVLAALATCSPGFHAWCVLDREAVAAGEVWRLWTGHLAHFSGSHLLVDALVFALLAMALRRAGERSPGRVLALGAAALSVSLLVGDFSLARYGGLSGLNALLVGRLVVRWFQAGGKLRLLGLALLTVTAGKFTLDAVGWGLPGVDFSSVAVVPSHLSHWLGLGWGLVLPMNGVMGTLLAPVPHVSRCR